MQVPFELAGKKLTEGQVRELLARGKTRVGRFVPGHGPPVRGRLVLDLEGGPRPGQPLVRFEPAA